MLKGRLGLESAKVPHGDRAGCLYPARGALTARDGTLGFQQGPATVADALQPGDYAIPLLGVSMIVLGPGSTVSHDALRLLAHARTAPAAVGDGVRLYTAPPLIPDRSGLARLQAKLRADGDIRVMIARRMYAMRLGEVLAVKRGRRRKRARVTRTLMPAAARPNMRWSMDFLSDTFGASRRFRILAANDDCCRENLCLIADTSFSGARVARAGRPDPGLRRADGHRLG